MNLKVINGTNNVVEMINFKKKYVPTICNSTNRLEGGCVDIWHSYKPASSELAYLK